MQIRTLLFGTVLTTGASIFSLRQIPDPVIPPAFHRQIPIAHHTPAKKIAVHAATKIARRETHPHSEKIAKQKTKHKPYFLARASSLS